MGLRRSVLVSVSVAMLAVSGCVAVPMGGAPAGGGAVPMTQIGPQLRGRSLVRPGETISLFSDGTFAWDGPNGQQSGTWTSGVDRLCLTVIFQGGSTSNYCGIAYIRGNQLEFLNDAGGAPVYWTIA